MTSVAPLVVDGRPRLVNPHVVLQVPEARDTVRAAFQTAGRIRMAFGQYWMKLAPGASCSGMGID